jgi:hypothetical protein
MEKLKVRIAGVGVWCGCGGRKWNGMERGVVSLETVTVLIAAENLDVAGRACRFLSCDSKWPPEIGSSGLLKSSQEVLYDA